MAITVKHLKVSTIPDSGDDSLIEPSDWNNDHVLTGTVPVANGGTGAATLTGYVKGNGTSAMTAATTIPNTDITGLGTASTKDAGAANGVATLDAGGKVPVSELPAAVLGALSYQGTWNASTNTPTLTSSVGTKGYYYVVDVAGSTNLNGITDWLVGDWAVFNGSVWQKIDNTESVTSVNGQTGAVTITLTGLGAGTIATQNANAVAITGGTINGTTIGATTASTGAFTTATASTSLTTPVVQATNSAGLALKNSAGTTQMSMGAGGGDNMAINVSTNLNGTNAQIDISPTGTGHVHINPSGSGSIEMNPTSAGTIDNMVIGGTTPKAITGTTITATSFVGSGASLTNVVNSLTASTGISVSGSTGAVTVTNTAPDQTVSIASGTGISATGTYPSFTVTNTAPDQTVVLNNGTGISVTGTYPNFTVTNTAPSSGGTVTSVSGTTGRITSTGGTTPVIDLASGIATAGTTGSSTLIPVVTIDTYGRVTGITTASNPQGTVTSVTGTAPVVSSGGATPAISMAAATGSVNGYLTSTDWTTFNSKAPAVTYTTNYVPYGQGTTTPNQSSSYTFDGTTQTAPIQRASNGIVVNSKTVSASYTIASGDCGMSVGPVTVATGQTVTVASGSRWVVL